VLYEQALIRFERARRTLPDDPDLLYFRAVALSGWHADLDGDGVDEHRTEEAIDAFEDLRRVAPEYHPDRVAFSLALLHARRSALREAITEYERVIASTIGPPSPLHYGVADRERALAGLFTPQPLATAYLNMAEALMLLGEPESLARAVESYRRASELGAGDPFDRATALWGLAVALDRAGDHREAILAAQRAIDADPVPDDVARLGIDHQSHGPMAILHSTLVFFEPAHEVHAYDALGWEALARRAGGDADRRELLERAVRAWREHLTGGGNAGAYADHARGAVERIEQELRR
jgi:tetratricopeptide (TPR) repeat protein